MKILLSWIAVFFSVWCIGFYINYKHLDSDLNWTWQLFNYKKKVSESIKEQKRIFVFGGSSVHYGIDTKILEKKLKIPAINFGLHGGLNLNPILGVASMVLRENDIAILSLEYGYLGSPNGSGWLSGMFGASIARPAIGTIYPKNFAREIFRAGVLKLPSFGKSVMKVMFGKEGRAVIDMDMRGNTKFFFPQQEVAPGEVDVEVSEYVFLRLIDFKKKMTDKGIQLYFALPWFLVEEKNQISFESVAMVAEKLSKIAPVFHCEMYCLQTDKFLFSDTSYHLTYDSRSIRTEKLAKEISQALGW